MGIVQRKERDRQEMKRQIMNAARKLFLEQGFEKTSIRNIADLIEYSPATIYLYYKDKNDLLFELHQEAFLKLIAEMQVVAPIQDPFERLKELGRQYLKFAIENPELYDLMFIMIAPMETLECKEEMWNDGRQALNLLEVVVADCIKAGYFKNSNVESVSLAIWSMVHGLAAIWLKNRLSIFPPEEWQQRFDGAYEYMIKMLQQTIH